MENKNNIQDELRGLNSELPSNPNKIPYEVPEGYFEGLASSVLNKIKNEQRLSASAEIAELSPLIANISRSNPYSLPDNYFQSNIESLPAFTSNDYSLVLSFIEKEMPYEVPVGYFANLPEAILEKVGSRKTKVVHMKSRKWMQWAVAAMITGFVAVSGIFYFNKGNNQTPVKDPVAVVKKASTQELSDFLKNTDVSLTENAGQLTAQNSSKPDAKKMFKDVSDGELQSFLSQVPTDDEDLDFN